MTDTNSTTRICSIEGCNDPVRTREWCNKHYLRWYRHGDPLAGASPRSRTTEEAFEMYAKPEGDCIVWTGPKNDVGYGQVAFRGRKDYAHRVAWVMENGDIPSKMEVNHKCWNPACVNVEHLNLATRSQNASYQNGPRADNTSGFRNVYWSKYHQCWYVQIKKDGKRHTKHGFKSPEEANEYAVKLRGELNGEFAGRG